MKTINTNLFDFSRLINDGYVYVDKTAQLYELAKPDLFRGLAIEKTDWDWENEAYPVLHLDMSVVASRTADELEISLQDLIEGLSAAFKAPFNPAKPAKTNFKNLLEALPRVAVRKT